MRVVIATVQVPFVRGGAEALATDLRHAIASRGHEVEIAAIPWKWFPAECILDQMLIFRLFDLSRSVAGPIDLLVALKFPAYLIPHPNKVVWLVHQHRMAYELWDDRYGLSREPLGAAIREAVERADRTAMGEAQGVFTISKTVTSRLKQYLGIDSSHLYPPLRENRQLFCDTAEDYLFFPSRIAPLKRQELALEALARTRQPVRICFSGSGDPRSYEEQMQQRAWELGVEDRVDWLGFLTENALARNYARARGVLFPPLDEDYGYVTLEAMLASKPVISCADSGATLEFISHHTTGLIADPEPESLAAAMDELWLDPGRARLWGEAGRKRYDEIAIGWDTVVESLLK